MINYSFNQWRVSGEQAESQISPRGYVLLNADAGRLSGQEIGTILYRHYVKGIKANELYKEYSKIAHHFIIQGILTGSGKFALAYNMFMELLEENPEELEMMFGETKRKVGEDNE
ncbi:hypothetical protein ACTWQL_19400 [Pseudalkalibacillus sp. R45]|uniref:hypothetical protein n=1 Tax=Pseudalkalibacillus sp. R45 TaxID=3457433 RepID=UPI003FCDED18